MATDNIGLDQIRAVLSEAGDPWEAGVTSLSSLTFEEQKQYLGVTPPPGELSVEEVGRRSLEKQAEMRAEALAAVNAPVAYDLRNVGGKNFVTNVKDQSSCGSCVAFGTVATVEGTLPRRAP